MNNKFYPPSCVRTMRAPTPSTRNMTRQCYKLVVYPLMLASDKYYYIKLVIHLLSNTVVRPPRRSGATNQGSGIGSHRKKGPLLCILAPQWQVQTSVWGLFSTSQCNSFRLPLSMCRVFFGLKKVLLHINVFEARKPFRHDHKVGDLVLIRTCSLPHATAFCRFANVPMC